jgi:branched-chain amino acid transport system ATP-binding protein
MSSDNGAPILETRGLTRRFGAFTAVNNVDFKLHKGERRALIGPNGAGKTTFINLLTGQLKPTQGEISLAGERIERLAPERRVKRGLGRTFQITSLCNDMTVLENVALAVAEREGVAGRIFRVAAVERRALEEAYGLLEQVGLAANALQLVRELPYGRQRLVEIALALALKPTVLLLDEPAAGIPSSESAIVTDVVASLPRDIAVLIIEHDMALVFRFATRITVLVEGALLVDGTPAEISKNAKVKQLYLGERHHG